MFIRELSVMNYKNFGEATLTFSRKLNCFISNNGVGKTNLLDAIYYLSFCKSYFNNPDSQNVRHEQDFFALQGKYELNYKNEEIHCGFKNGQKKKIRRNKKEYERFSEHIGLLPLVMISPADAVLIQGGSEERRRFMDSVISQYDRTYLEWLVRYNRALLQRNVLLKEVAGRNNIDPDIFAIWDDQLVHLGEKIHLKRTSFLKELLPVFQKYYTLISGGNEFVSLEYSSQLNEKEFLGSYHCTIYYKGKKPIQVVFSNRSFMGYFYKVYSISRTFSSAKLKHVAKLAEKYFYVRKVDVGA